MVASRSVQWAVKVRSIDPLERRGVAGMDLQLGVGQALAAHEGHLDLGVRQEEQVLARCRRRCGTPGCSTRAP